MSKVCHLCNKGEIIHDKKMSAMFCTGCGECFELGTITDDVQYRENARGQFVASGTSYNVEKGFVNSNMSQLSTQHDASLENAWGILKRYCNKLCISERFAELAKGYYHSLLIRKLTYGRRLNILLASCLYVAVRVEGANVILLDISDVSEANVYDIGRLYLYIVHKLFIKIQIVDPCEYVVRFVDMINLGHRDLPQVKRTSLCIRDTANRLVQRMKRDWIHYGRRPSGVCAAAVLVAARVNNVRCSIVDIVSIARVCESTIRKRISEFIETPSSQLTYKEFMSQDLDREEDPPIFKVSNTMQNIEENLQKVEKYQEIIEEQLKESRAKLRGVYAKFLKEILFEQEPDTEEKAKTYDENEVIKEAIIDQNILAIDSKLGKTENEINFQPQNGPVGNPSAEEIEYWAKLRPSAKSLGLLKNDEPKQQQQIDYEDLLSENLDDIDDEEIDKYLVYDECEIKQREKEWYILNKDFLEKEKEKETKRSLEDKEAQSSTNVKGKKKRRKIDMIESASSASEAVEAACKAKSIMLNDIDLKELFNEKSENSNSTTEMSTSTSAAAAAVAERSSSTVLIDDDDEQTIVDTNLAENNEEDPSVVNLYHSYAMKTPLTPKESPRPPMKEPEKTNLYVMPVADDDDDNEDDDDDNDDDCIDDDDDDDELRKIKMKYSMANDSETEDFEDCGF